MYTVLCNVWLTIWWHAVECKTKGGGRHPLSPGLSLSLSLSLSLCLSWRVMITCWRDVAMQPPNHSAENCRQVRTYYIPLYWVWYGSIVLPPGCGYTNNYIIPYPYPLSPPHTLVVCGQWNLPLITGNARVKIRTTWIFMKAANL